MPITPEKIINNIEIKEGASVADFGCGSGGFTISVAKKVKNGKIYAIDLSEKSLSVLKRKLEAEKIYNVRLVLSDIEKGVDLKEEFIDLVIVANLLFQVEDKEKIIKEAYRVLRKEGELLIVDWKKGEVVGIKQKALPEEVKNIALKASFKTDKEFDVLPYHYVILFKKT